jgi:hypothetical protein
MYHDRDSDVVVLLKKKLQAAQELLKLMKEPTDFEDEAAFSASIDKWQRLLDNVALLDGELAETARRNGAAASTQPEESALSRSTDDVIRQIQLIMIKDIEQVKMNMDFYLGEAKKLRKRKSGLMAYRINGLPSQKQRLDLRG